ncbi:complex I NDUFA9 subunit family protein [Sneathiella sp.]|mgnify:CR=1 FL=1|uniref:complex I NDUFA9 subunit family protein n=1 Tax=Sneathiella sp. TaxID=1964365 RepID=UPI002FDF96ED
MSGQLITIFGGSGFIGRHLVERLGARGYQIRIAVRDTESALPLMTQGNVGQIVGFQTNIRNQESVERAVAGADIVINLVGILFEKGAQTFEAVHVEAAARIAAAARKAGVKQLVHMSALGVAPDHAAAYARSKAAGEERVTYEFPGASIIRPAVVFGNDDQFFNRFAGIFALAPVFPLAGGGKSRMQPVWVEDVSDAIVRIIETPEAQGKTYELAGPDVLSFKELMEKVLEFTRRRTLLLPVPYGLMSAFAALMSFVPGRPPLTPDQVTLLKHDNVASGDLPGLADLGIHASSIDAIVPDYLRRFQRGGGVQVAHP